MMELISENSEELEALTVFGKKTPSYMFERVLITSRWLYLFHAFVNKVT